MGNLLKLEYFRVHGERDRTMKKSLLSESCRTLTPLRLMGEEYTC